MDAGVPVTRVVAGVAMGLILDEDDLNGGEAIILTDILGLEDGSWRFFEEKKFLHAKSKCGTMCLVALRSWHHGFQGGWRRPWHLHVPVGHQMRRLGH